MMCGPGVLLHPTVSSPQQTLRPRADLVRKQRALEGSRSISGGTMFSTHAPGGFARASDLCIAARITQGRLDLAHSSTHCNSVGDLHATFTSTVSPRSREKLGLLHEMGDCSAAVTPADRPKPRGNTWRLSRPPSWSPAQGGREAQQEANRLSFAVVKLALATSLPFPS